VSLLWLHSIRRSLSDWLVVPSPCIILVSSGRQVTSSNCSYITPTAKLILGDDCECVIGDTTWLSVSEGQSTELAHSRLSMVDDVWRIWRMSTRQLTLSAQRAPAGPAWTPPIISSRVNRTKRRHAIATTQCDNVHEMVLSVCPGSRRAVVDHRPHNSEVAAVPGSFGSLPADNRLSLDRDILINPL